MTKYGEDELEAAWKDLFERQARERERSVAERAARKEAIALARKLIREKGERKLVKQLQRDMEGK